MRWFSLTTSKRMPKKLFVVNRCSLVINFTPRQLLVVVEWVHVLTKLVVSETQCKFRQWNQRK